MINTHEAGAKLKYFTEKDFNKYSSASDENCMMF